MNISRTSNVPAQQPKKAATTIQVEVPSTQNVLESTESFVTGRGGSTIMSGVGGLIPGVGIFTGVRAMDKLDASDAKEQTPAVTNALKFAAGTGAAASFFSALSIADGLMQSRETLLGPWTTAAIVVSGATSAIASYVAATEFQS